MVYGEKKKKRRKGGLVQPQFRLRQVELLEAIIHDSNNALLNDGSKGEALLETMAVQIEYFGLVNL